jgi:CDP-paratose 2-epimerase
MTPPALLVTGSSGLIGSEVAAQPSHDRAAAIPFDDFDTNAVGTLNLLEAARRACPDSPFVHMSTNKVYGDAPNEIPLVELATRWDYADGAFAHGIPESFRVDSSKHSLFGASKVAADVAAFIERFIAAPRPAAVYNIGGGKANSCSILEAFEMAASRTGKPMDFVYSEQAREGDHICYYSDLRKMQADYPGWSPEITLAETFDQIVEAWERRQVS